MWFREGVHDYWTEEEYDLLVKNLRTQCTDDDLEEEVDVLELQDILDEEALNEGVEEDDEDDEDDGDEDADEESDVVLNDRGLKHACPLNKLQSFHSVGSFQPGLESTKFSPSCRSVCT